MGMIKQEQKKKIRKIIKEKEIRKNKKREIERKRESKQSERRERKRMEKSRERNLSLRSTEIGSWVFVRARGKVNPHNEGYTWVPKSRSFVKL